MPARAAVAAGHRRRALAPGLLVLLLLVVAGCGDGAGSEAGPTAGPTTGPALASPTGSPPVELVGEAGDFPTTVQDYAELTVAAWAAPDLLRLGQLATSEVHRALIELPGPPDRGWTFLRCEDPDPVDKNPVRCYFHNTDGDQLRLSIDERRLGSSRAATGTAFEATTFPDQPVAYVEALIAAWEIGNHPRMRALATPAAAAALGQVTPPPAPEISYGPVEGDGPVLAIEVTVDAEARTTLSFSLNESLLGQARAVRTATVEPA